MDNAIDRLVQAVSLHTLPVLRDIRRRQRVLLKLQVAEVLILLLGLTAIIGVLLVGI